MCPVLDDGAPAPTDGAIHSIMEQTGPAEVRSVKYYWLSSEPHSMDVN